MVYVIRIIHNADDRPTMPPSTAARNPTCSHRAVFIVAHNTRPRSFILHASLSTSDKKVKVKGVMLSARIYRPSATKPEVDIPQSDARPLRRQTTATFPARALSLFRGQYSIPSRRRTGEGQETEMASVAGYIQDSIRTVSYTHLTLPTIYSV